MKVEQSSPTFQPVVITLQSAEEVYKLRRCLSIAKLESNKLDAAFALELECLLRNEEIVTL